MEFTKIAIIFLLSVFGSVFGLHNKYCQLSCDYGFQIKSHTVCNRNEEKCGPNPKCGPDFKVIPLTDQMRQYVLDIHNYFRNRVAMGNETINNQPPATNMMAMTYNEELEFIAQCWANACNGNPLVHDDCRRTEKFQHVGQNLGYLNSSIPITNIYKAMKDLIVLWYNEVKDFRNEWIFDTQDRGDSVVVGHYTQMLWADTSEMGCALASYNEPDLYSDYIWHQILFVCNYGPAGNFLGAPLYKIGKPSSECQKGFAPNQHYYGLCGPTFRVSQTKIKRKINIFDQI